MLLTFVEAKERLHHAATVSIATKMVEHETIPIDEAVDRINAAPIISPIDVPVFDNSAMDGYAVRLSDLANPLPVAKAIFAGDDIKTLNWEKGSCLRIMTGAPVPSEADCVIMQEECEKTANGITFLGDLTKVKRGQNIRRAGEDVAKGSTLCPAGVKLTVPLLSTIATLGIANLTVYRPLKVALFSTGNELTPLGNPLPHSGAIYDSNRFTLKLLLKKLQCEVIDLGIIPDDLNKIKQTLIDASMSADLVITSGGVSVGDADYIKTALTELGKVEFWKIAIKPGKPFAFGHIGNALFCGLPGNPVSTLVTFYQLVQPLILTLSGLSDNEQNEQRELLTFQVKTATDLKKVVGRLDFQRGLLQTNGSGELEVTTTGAQGSHITHSVNSANCFIILEQERGAVKKGEWVTVELFNHLLS
ncbi:molybdopterin molybdotransferase MoeA [Orbaceae bacterium ESL0721]|nr:molybdopterin molybdotransferase MoeA [Orbaceae bacterium ESL0721]